MIVPAPLEETWARLSTLRLIRSDSGVVLLEEADDDTHTAALRVNGETVVVALEADGDRTRVRATPPMITDLLAAALGPTEHTPTPEFVLETEIQGPGPFRLVAAGVAAAGIAYLATRRRR